MDAPLDRSSQRCKKLVQSWYSIIHCRRRLALVEQGLICPSHHSISIDFNLGETSNGPLNVHVSSRAEIRLKEFLAVLINCSCSQGIETSSLVSWSASAFLCTHPIGDTQIILLLEAMAKSARTRQIRHQCKSSRLEKPRCFQAFRGLLPAAIRFRGM